MNFFKNLKAKFEATLHRIWYQEYKPFWHHFLAMGSYFYVGIFYWLRSKAQRHPYRSTVPVVVVGNITVGGNGKTPAILALITLLQKHNLKPGVISRGYPVNPHAPILINENTTTNQVSDEPLLIYQKTRVPVCVCSHRPLAIQQLENLGVDIILSDDGLQNFSFEHAMEIIMVDSTRLFGNKKVLPAGPLREPLSRLRFSSFTVEKLVNNQAPSSLGFHYQLRLKGEHFYAINKALKLDETKSVDASFFHGKKVLAITTIAQPESFFQQLRQLGLIFESLSKEDHAPLSMEDFAAYTDYEIVMTEKDAVKCENIANASFWCMPLIGHFSENFEDAFLKQLKKVF